MSGAAFVIRLCALAVAMVHAGAMDLEFSVTAVSITPTVEDTTRVVSFPFINRGQNAVRIVDVRVGCHCLTPSLEKSNYAVGERGSLDLIYDLQDSVGHQRRRISLITRVEGRDSEECAELTIEAFIPSPLLFDARRLTWSVGEVPSTKRIAIQVKPDFTVADLHVVAPEHCPFMRVSSALGADMRTLSIAVTPVTTRLQELSVSAAEDVTYEYLVKYRLLPRNLEKHERFMVAVRRDGANR
jgi:hypothetical protein